MRNILSAIILVAFAAPAALAQSTAIRFILGEGHKVYEGSKFGNYCMGLGVDRSFNSKLTAGLDVAIDISHALKDAPDHAYLSRGSFDIAYAMKPSLLSINYHTEYALGDDDGTHMYIGTFIGLRHLRQEWTLENAYYTGNFGTPIIVPAPPAVSAWLVPVGLRAGLRGATDSGFMDLYAALGYQIGGGKHLLPGDFARTVEGLSRTNTIAVTIGLAFGFGW